MCPLRKDKGFEIRLQLTEIEGQMFLIPVPILDYSGFPRSEIRTRERGSDAAKRIETSVTTSAGTDEFYEVEAEPVTSEHSSPAESAPMNGYEPTLIVERPRGQPLSLDAPANGDWKITVRRPEGSLSVPKRRLSKMLILLFLLFLAFGICYWLKVEPVRGKTDSFLKELILLVMEKPRTTTSPSIRKEMRTEESEFKKSLRKHLKRILED